MIEKEIQMELRMTTRSKSNTQAKAESPNTREPTNPPMGGRSRQPGENHARDPEPTTKPRITRKG